MAQNYKIENTLKNLPFYSEEIRECKKKNKILSELPFFAKKISNFQLSKELPFFPKRSKRPKRLTKYQALKNILPFYDSVSISRIQHAFRNYAETYDVEVVDRISLSDSLFLGKSSIIDLFKDLLKQKRGFKYILSVRVTLKRWNNETNTYDIDTIFRNSAPITVTNQICNLNSAYEELKHNLDFGVKEVQDG